MAEIGFLEALALSPSILGSCWLEGSRGRGTFLEVPSTALSPRSPPTLTRQLPVSRQELRFLCPECWEGGRKRGKKVRSTDRKVGLGFSSLPSSCSLGAAMRRNGRQDRPFSVTLRRGSWLLPAARIVWFGSCWPGINVPAAQCPLHLSCTSQVCRRRFDRRIVVYSMSSVFALVVVSSRSCFVVQAIPTSVHSSAGLQSPSPQEAERTTNRADVVVVA